MYLWKRTKTTSFLRDSVREILALEGAGVCCLTLARVSWVIEFFPSPKRSLWYVSMSFIGHIYMRFLTIHIFCILQI